MFCALYSTLRYVYILRNAEGKVAVKFAYLSPLAFMI